MDTEIMDDRACITCRKLVIKILKDDTEDYGQCYCSIKREFVAEDDICSKFKF